MDALGDFLADFRMVLGIIVSLVVGIAVLVNVRWRASLRFGVSALAAVIALFLAGFYIHDYVFAPTTPEAEASRVDVVSAFVTLLGGFAILTAAYSGWQNYRSSQENLRVAKDTLRLEQDRETGERFSGAVELLAMPNENGKSLTAQIGGLYILEQIAHEWFRRAHSFAEETSEEAVRGGLRSYVNVPSRGKGIRRDPIPANGPDRKLSETSRGQLRPQSAEETDRSSPLASANSMSSPNNMSSNEQAVIAALAIKDLIVREYEDKYWSALKLLCDYVMAHQRESEREDGQLRRDVEVALDAIGRRPSPLDWEQQGQILRPNLRGCDFNRSEVTRRNFAGTDLTKAKFNRATVWKADFRGAVLKGAEFNGALVSKCKFNDMEISRADQLTGLIPGHALKPVETTSAKFQGADLEGVDLTQVYGLTVEMLDGTVGITIENLPVHLQKAWQEVHDQARKSTAPQDDDGS